MRAVIALGSNMDAPIATTQAAVQTIARLDGIRVVKSSSLYRTKPVGYADQDDFINAILIIDTNLEPVELLARLSKVEDNFGRVREIKNGPRTLDLDVILCDDVVQNDEKLTLPHPRAQERAFVMGPIAEIAPNLEFPDSKLTAQAIFDKLSTETKAGITRLSEPVLVPVEV